MKSFLDATSSIAYSLFSVIIILFTGPASGYFLQIMRGREKLIHSNNLVIITGCDSGIGKLTAKSLADQGFIVLSTCMTEQGLETLKPIVHSVILCDVTNETDIANLVIEVENILNSTENDNLRLWCLINNAGIAPIGFIDWLSISSIKKVMDVNYLGTEKKTIVYML